MIFHIVTTFLLFVVAFSLLGMGFCESKCSVVERLTAGMTGALNGVSIFIRLTLLVIAIYLCVWTVSLIYASISGTDPVVMNPMYMLHYLATGETQTEMLDGTQSILMNSDPR